MATLNLQILTLHNVILTIFYIYVVASSATLYPLLLKIVVFGKAEKLYALSISTTVITTVNSTV